ncbi:MAG: ATP-dependent Clp protease proteolytic subunit [Rubrobacteridae bacterium]|nr:ATP-dependent Clp protease proteolytic subunit [Rubrobacteridae bacterium]
MENQESQSIKQPPVLFSKTQSVITEISTILGGQFISYWNNPKGDVNHDDVLALYAILERLGKQESIYLYIKSSGGSGQAALRLVSLMRQYCDKLVVLAPLECASAATMIALGANQIMIGPMAYLTPVDTSLTHDLSPVDRDNDRVSVSLDELTRLINLWKTERSDINENPYKVLFQYVHPLVIGAVNRAESLSIMLCRELLSYHIEDEEVSDRIANTLNSKYPSHDYPILFEEAKKLGLKVDHMPLQINALLLELNEIYSEMGQAATTDFDEIRAHGNEILNIWETVDHQIYYQEDKDWFYREEERRWITMNDNSSWRRIERINGKTKKTILHIV